jgi:hypothetical protein
MPQRIEVVFHGKFVQAARDSWLMPTPQLGDLTVQNVLWTVDAPRDFQRSAASSARPSNALRQELARLKSIAAVTTLASAILPSEAGEEISAWYAPWARRYVATLAAVRRELSRNRESEEVRAAEVELRFLEQEQSQIARRLGMPQSMLRPTTTLASAEQPRQLWSAVTSSGPPPLRFISSGPIEALIVEASGGTTANWLPRIFWALAVMLVAAGMIVVLRSPYAQRLVAWRHLAGVAAGLAWWWWLWPGLLGWIIVAASLVAILRARRPARSEGESAVVRLASGSRG